MWETTIHMLVLYGHRSSYWISFDLGTPKKITSVIITSPKISNADLILQAGHVLYSNSSSSTPGNFSKFKTFGTFSTFESAEIKKIERSHPRHIAITSEGLRMFICHVLILWTSWIRTKIATEETFINSNIGTLYNVYRLFINIFFPIRIWLQYLTT